MAIIGSWYHHRFEVSESAIRGFTDLNIKGSVETEDEENSTGGKWAKPKNGKPAEVTLTVHLYAQLGCDVRAEAGDFVMQASEGKMDYFYIGDKKLLPYPLILTEAEVSGIVMTNRAEWTQADIKLTMKQCESDGSGDGGGSSDDSSSGGDSSGGGGGGTTYKVQIPGMSVVTVTAGSVQAAITAAGCGSWTGTVYVNDASYYVVQGVIGQDPNTASAASDTPAPSSAVQTAAQNIVNKATTFISNLVSKAKSASSQKTSNTTTSTTTTVTVKKTTTKRGQNTLN